MIEMYFSLRFQSQLRRTRPKLLRNLEQSIVSSIESFGGAVHTENKLTSARFNGKSIGFWLDMLCVLENIKSALEKASSELYGHICVVGQDIPADDVAVLVRSLPSDLWGTGIWVSPRVKPFLESYLDFEEPLSGAEFNPVIKGYIQVRAIRDFGGLRGGTGVLSDNSAKIRQYLKQGVFKNTVIVGDEHIGKHEGIRSYCAEQMGDFPPLVIRFGQNNNVLAVLSDALSPSLKSALGEGAEGLEELRADIFRERLRDELSDFLVKKGERFFALLLERYRLAADARRIQPVLILENIQEADPMTRLLISGLYFSLPARERIYIYGACTKMDALEPWEELFPRIIKFSPEKNPERGSLEMPRDLWEMAYCCVFFRAFFPGFLTQKLFEEEGKNPEMIRKALNMLGVLGIIDASGEPEKKLPVFVKQAEKHLGADCEKVKQVVRGRLLDWVGRGLIKPCFRLLAELSALGGEGNDALVQDAICGDIENGTYSGIDKAIKNGTFGEVVGKGRENSLLTIVHTLKALIHGSPEKIHEAFVKPPQSDSSYPGFKSRILSNQAAYCLSIEENAAAAAAVKEAMLITQNENFGRGLAQVYRLFSLVEFAGQSLSDALDYFAFAVEHAEKSGDNGELAVSAYYASGAHFIFGNISKAERLAVQALEAALASGRPFWADRSAFLRGRLRFEAGRYQEALDIFKALEAESVSSIETNREFKQTLAAWIYRANIYLHNTRCKHEGGADAAFFEVEAAFLSGEYRRTLELANALEGHEGGERFLFIEQPDWRSGFAQCELFLFPMGDLWKRMVHTYRAMAMCHINSPGNDTFDRDEAIKSMQRIMRDELPDTDPNDAFYYYSYYKVLKRSGAPEVDMNTAISIAFKRLQRRASRIDDNEVKRGFLSSHYWNGALAAIAKEHKLI
ncbi:MAG: ATP-binding protein [Treponema sp.]|jgi:tetratricopeptide (TPR) repeat protein|nr:ATP-binding protein [Treponema sp.]